MYIGTPQKPLENKIYLSDYKNNIYKKLNSGEFLCSFEDQNLRKVIFELKNKLQMNIQTLQCDCNNYKRIHKAYYYEWATEFRL